MLKIGTLFWSKSCAQTQKKKKNQYIPHSYQNTSIQEIFFNSRTRLIAQNKFLLWDWLNSEDFEILIICIDSAEKC